MKAFNIYGRDCFGKLWFRGQIYASNANEALKASHAWRKAVGGNVASLRGDLATR